MLHSRRNFLSALSAGAITLGSAPFASACCRRFSRQRFFSSRLITKMTFRATTANVDNSTTTDKLNVLTILQDADGRTLNGNWQIDGVGPVAGRTTSFDYLPGSPGWMAITEVRLVLGGLGGVSDPWLPISLYMDLTYSDGSTGNLFSIPQWGGYWFDNTTPGYRVYKA